MPPADPAALSAALATYREYQGRPVRVCRGSGPWLDATELLASEFVRRLDAGELVRMLPPVTRPVVGLDPDEFPEARP